MKQKQQDIVISSEVALGLVAVLQTALVKGQLKGREKRFAFLYVETLEKTLQTHKQKAKVQLSLQTIANLLRIILVIIKPDPLLTAAIHILTKFL